jgi:O-antigen ligase
VSATTLRVVPLAVALGATVGYLAAQRPGLLVLATAAVVGIVVARRPLLLFGLFLMVDHTYSASPYYQDVGPLVTTGHQLYQPVKHVQPALLLLVLAFGMQVYAGRGAATRTIRAHGLDMFGIVLVALIGWSAMLSLAQEEADFSTQSMITIVMHGLGAVQPWLLVLAAYAVAVPMLREPGRRAALVRLIGGVLIVKGALSLVVLVTTQGANVDGQRFVVHYDAALPMVAGMAIIGFLLAAERGVPWRRLLLVLAAVIVVFSFRRSVWTAMAAAILVLPLIRMNRVVVRRLLVGAAVAVVVLLVLPESVKGAVFGRVGSAVSVAQGTGTEDSARNHKIDLVEGYRLAKQHPWLGLGVRAPQRPEFAFQEIDKLYVHNDPLQVWLLYGFPGIALFVMLLAVLCRRGVATLRRTKRLTLLDAGCAAFAVAVVVAVLPAPFISDTVRWPILLGLVAAVLRTAATDEPIAAAQ